MRRTETNGNRKLEDKFCGLFLLLMLTTGCVSYDLPDHKYCIVFNGDPDKSLKEQEGKWIDVGAGTYYDFWFPHLGNTNTYYERQKCLENKKVPVVLEYVLDLDYCVLPEDAPKGCH
jgi:hypothetical protein